MGIVGTPASPGLRALVQEASALLDAPIAVISLIDHDRQWFKVAVGLEATETPRSVSFCGHTIEHRGMMLVQDTQHDERFKRNPLTEALNIRFYAGVTLSAPTGEALGALCVIDHTPRVLSVAQLSGLKHLSARAEALLLEDGS